MNFNSDITISLNLNIKMEKKMKKFRLVSIIITGLLLLIIAACSSQQKETVDLDKVLNIMQSTLDELNKSTPVNSGIYTDNNSSDTMLPIPADNQNEDYNQVFVQKFQKNLNNAQIAKGQIGVQMPKDGSVEGYIDSNNNFSQDINEKTIFKVEIDVERNRLIATDTQNQYRRSTGYSFARGMFAGYLLRSMFGRQRGMGIMPSRFSNMKMSRNNYRKSGFFSKTKSARSSGGSRSFKGGK